MNTKHKKLSVLMLPWLAHGHISPYLELANKLAERNIHVYLCSTPVNLDSVKGKIPAKYAFSIELIELHLPSLPELPPHYHSTNGLPPNLMSTLKKAFDMSSPNFYTILKTLTPDLLVYDFLQPWAPKLASSLNIPAVEFLTTGATLVSWFFHLKKAPGSEFPFPGIYYKACQLRESLESFQDDGIKDEDRLIECCERSVDIILVKSFRMIEGKYIDYASVILNKKLIPVGPLVADPIEENDNNTKDPIIEWLNKKEISSTVFVSFGTEYFLSSEELKQTACGLEQSMVNFIWVIRFPEGNKMGIEDLLPEGYIHKLGNRGLIVEKWAPQGKILRHRSIGGFVSHCGWSSVMEAMKFGVPIIAIPMQLDQPFNVRLMEEVGVGIEVKRSQDGKFEGEDMAKAIRAVVVEKNGENVRRKVKKMSEKMRENGNEAVDLAVEELVRICRKTTHTSDPNC